jgi:hypothetical protein
MFGPDMRRWHVKGQIWTPPSGDSVASGGYRAVTVHHGTAVNPYINYPFLTADKLANYSLDLAKAHIEGGRSSAESNPHSGGVALSVYYTMRELSNHAAELPLFGGLGAQVLVDDTTTGLPISASPGGAWLGEHVGAGYTAAWVTTMGGGDAPHGTTTDNSLTTSGSGIWRDHYVAGAEWLVG